MANNRPGAASPPSPHQPRVAGARPTQAPTQPRPPQPNRPQPQLKQAKHVPTPNVQNRGAGPHINQHSAHLQRTVQAKMAQPPAAHKTIPKPAAQARNGGASGQPLPSHKSIVQPKFTNSAQAFRANRVVSPSIARPSGVVQPACVGEFFSSVWRSLTSCFSSPRTGYDEIPDRGLELRQNTSAPRRVETPVLRSRLVDQEDTVNNVPYPANLNAGLITSCALVIFCGDSSFDCYHASGGNYSGAHGMRNNPTRIYYVYKSLVTDSRETVQEYERNARLFQISGGRAGLTVLGQRGVNGNILVNVMSAAEIGPSIGTFI